MSFRFEAQNDPSSLSPVCDIAPACTTLQDETPVHQPRAVHFVLGFSHLTYSVKASRRVVLPGFSKKTILDDISGEARDGEIMAVMGASGSGKSTLIDALANRMAKGSVKGSITLNGEQLESRLSKVISAYVMQDDLLFPMLTVEETLMFAAEFRLPRTLSNSEKKQRVQALIDQLGLRHAANTVIGDEDHRGISGGERRRVSIGTVIIPDPIMLFLDEPTTGLDSTSAFMVVQVLQRIAQSGSIVIMSIHQPSSRIMGSLDRMIFLSSGKTVFHGAPSDLPLYLSELGQPIPDNENRTELALDLVGELEVEFNKSWHQSNPAAENVSNSSLKEAICSSISRGKLISGATPFANPPWIELAVLSRRSFTNSRRMPKLLRGRVTTVVVTGFILATVFWRLDNSRKGAQDHLGFFAFAMATTIYFCTDGMPVFLQERYIVTREMACDAYRRSSYVLSHSLVSIPALVFLSLAFAAITFWAVGLDGSFLFYFFIIFASFWVSSSFITFLSGIVPHLLLGYMIVAAMLNYFRLFSGFFITRGRIPPYWVWFHYISPLKYSYQAVVQNEFRDLAKCFVRGVQIFDGTPLAAVAESMKVELLESMKIDNATCITTAADILRQRSFDDLSKWDCLWLMLAWGGLFPDSVLGLFNRRRQEQEMIYQRIYILNYSTSVDSTSAFIVVKVLQRIAHSGSTV